MTNVWDKYKSKISGVWDLKSFKVYDGIGPGKNFIEERYGGKPFGRTVVLSSGYLVGTQTSPETSRPLPQPDTAWAAWQLASDADVAKIARNYSTYGGPLKLYERSEEDKKDGEGDLEWECTTEIALNPNLVGIKQFRRIKIEEQDGKIFMVLSPKNMMVTSVSFFRLRTEFNDKWN